MEQQNISINNQQIVEQIDLTTRYLMENIDKLLIIFCNPLSGDREGKIFLNLANNYLTKEKYKLIDFQHLLNTEKYEPIKATFFELINLEDKVKGELLLKHCTEKCKINKEAGLPENFQKVKVLIASGDGTVISMVDDFVKKGVDINYCIFGHIPLGTGNDLSNTLGFSDHIHIYKNNLNDLYKILLKYHKAKLVKIDVWKIDFELDPIDGEVLCNTKEGKIPLKDENGNIIKSYIRSFINYASLGYDARVGYNFDPKRSSGRNLNKCIYFLEGAKKMFCRKTNSIQKFIDTITVYESENNSINQESFFSDNRVEQNTTLNPFPVTSTQNSNTQKAKFTFMSKESFNLNKCKGKCLVLRGKPCSIVFQNVVNYMSGVKNIWGKGKKLSIKLENVTEEEKKKYTEKLKQMASLEQKIDDEMLEVFTFDNGLQTGFEKVIGGLSKKIYHGRGPIEIKFLPSIKYTKEDKRHRIYFNIDGEYFHIVKPILLRIEINRDYCGGKLPFLVENS